MDKHDTTPFIDDKGQEYLAIHVERVEQYMAYKFIQKSDNVLELGSRFGTNSCLIARLCNRLVAVDPDKKATEVCKENMKRHGVSFDCEWCIVSKNPQEFIDDGYSSYTRDSDTSEIPNFTIQQLEEKYGLKFNVLVADCEGCLEKVAKENDLSGITKILYEQDNECNCNYGEVEKVFEKLGLRCVEATCEQPYNLYRKCWII